MPPETGRALCIVMHDVTRATWPDCERLLTALRAVAPAPVTLLLVPEFHRGQAARRDPRFCALMGERLGQGDELALHGFRHHDDAPLDGLGDRLLRSVYTAAEGEFAALDAAAADRRLAAGVEWFREQGWPLEGFVAPAWLMSAGTWQALARYPLTYTSTLTRLYLLPEALPLEAPSLVFSARSPWRRRISHYWVDGVAAARRSASCIRLGLHPIDANYPDVVLHWQKLFERLLDTHQPCTKATLARLTRVARVARLAPAPRSLPDR
jgi:predicted deacetylase